MAKIGQTFSKTKPHLLHRLICFTIAQGFQIHNYKSHLVSLKEGRGWIIDGSVKLVHTIDLEPFERLQQRMNASLTNNVKDPYRRVIIEHYLGQIKERLNQIISKPNRVQRSINWIGSAWKWIAGNPDAEDWSKILQSEQRIIENNNHQYVINEKLLGSTKQITQKMNLMIEKYKNGIKEAVAGKIEQDLLDEIQITKEEINEIVRACQMAKSGVINTNLLDSEEINKIINELETLPYANDIEAIEYGKPSIYTNGSMLLYVLSIPKVGLEEFNLLITRPSIIERKQIDLKYSNMLVNHQKTYGLIDSCLSINNVTVCESRALEKVAEDSCLARLLKGGPTTCTFRTNSDEIVELLKEDTVFATNFNGQLTSNHISRNLSGTYIIKIHNETITLGNRSFTSSMRSSTQALPPVLANITKRDYAVDVGYVHDLSLQNIKRIGNLNLEFNISMITEAVVLTLVIYIIILIWKKLHTKLEIPGILTANLPHSPDLKGPKDLRDADI